VITNNFNEKKTWNTIADSFDKTRREPWDICIDFVNNLDEEIYLIDLGCGNGRHLISSATKIKNCVGCDISIELLKIIKEKISFKKLENVSLINSDACCMPIRTESIDAVLYIASLHNIRGRKNRLKSLSEINRILKINGKALISVWSRWQDRYRKEFQKKIFLQFLKDREFGDKNIYWKKDALNIPRFYHLYSASEFKKDLKNSGLKLIEFKSINIRSKNNPDNFFATVKKIK
jgi:ubiquinone/menaquinone biosynthesis C-methylase UbiE